MIENLRYWEKIVPDKDCWKKQKVELSCFCSAKHKPRISKVLLLEPTYVKHTNRKGMKDKNENLTTAAKESRG